MNKSKQIVFSIFLTFNLTLITQHCFSQNWQWAKKGGSISKDRMANMCVDNNNNVYIIGSFGYTGVTLPSANYAVFDNDTVYNNGANQLYLVKYSSTGNVLWAKSMGGYNPLPGSGLCDYCEAAHEIYYEPVTDALYMTGSLYGTEIFGNDTLPGWGDGVFFTKIDMSGNFIWAKYLQKASVSALASDTLGNIYMAGGGADSATFDSIKLPAGGFIAKYSPQGTCLWAKQKLIGAGITKLKIVNNNIFIVGFTLNDTASVDTSIHYSTINNNGFVAKLDSLANMLWIKYTNSNVNSVYSRFVIDTSGNIYTLGTFQTDVTLGDTTLNSISTNGDLFFSKYDSLGNFIWAKQANATTKGRAKYITNDISGNFYVGGSFTGTITFNSFSLTSTLPTQDDYFIARFDSSGTCLGLILLPANVTSMGESTLGEVYITGEFSGTKTFGSYPLTGEIYGDVYVAKMDGAVGIENARMATTNNALVIYANPNKGTCNITVPNELLHEQNLVLTIYDNNGKLIQQKQVQIEQEKIKVNIEAEAKGVYNVTLGNKTKLYSGKIVFE